MFFDCSRLPFLAVWSRNPRPRTLNLCWVVYSAKCTDPWKINKSYKRADDISWIKRGVTSEDTRGHSIVLCTSKGRTDVTWNIDAISGQNDSIVCGIAKQTKTADLNSRTEFITLAMLQRIRLSCWGLDKENHSIFGNLRFEQIALVFKRITSQI